MASTLTIRDLEDSVKERLRLRAAKNGHSMEEEARVILRSATAEGSNPTHRLAESIRARFAKLGGLELELLPREPLPGPLVFK